MRGRLLALVLEHMLVLLAVLCIGVAVGATSIVDALMCCIGAIVVGLCAVYLRDVRFNRSEDIRIGEPGDRFYGKVG